MKTLALVAALLSAAPPYPLAEGTKWTYAAHVTYQVDGAKKEKDLTWTVTVKKKLAAAPLEVWQVEGHPRELSFYEEGRKPALYCVVRRGDEQHVLEDTPLEKVAAALSPDTLELAAPYTPGAMFGDPEQIKNTPGRYCWVVEKADANAKGVKGAPPATGPAFAVRMTTNPDHTVVTVVPGVGVVRHEYVHHGTPGDARLELVEYTPGK